MKLRLKALEEEVAKDDVVLTETQVEASERAQFEREAHGEIETEHPDYLGSQDTLCVGTLKGVERVYQQTFVDTYCKVAIVLTDHLKDRALPFLGEHSVRVIQMLTDRRTEFCSKPSEHR